MAEFLELLKSGEKTQKEEKPKKVARVTKPKEEQKEEKPKKSTLVEKESKEQPTPTRRQLTEKQAEGIVMKVLSELGIDKPINEVIDRLMESRTPKTTATKKIDRNTIIDLFMEEKMTNPKLRWYRHKSHGKYKKFPFSDELDWLMEHFDIITKQEDEK